MSFTELIRRHWPMISLLIAGSSIGLFEGAAGAAAAHPEVMVVYNSNYAESLTVANHYLSARGIPASNLCAITPPANDFLSLGQYTTFVKGPVQGCLNALGQRNILYIVFSYLTPFAILTGPNVVAALDSFVADIWDRYATQPFVTVPNIPHGYYADSQSQGNVFQPFMSFATYRANPRSTLIYSVWRLDAPSAAIASALVDQAIQAEGTGGPGGQACIDRIFGDLSTSPDTGFLTTDWDLHAAASFLALAGITVVEDSNNAEFGTAPAPLTCPNTALFSGWYSLDNYNDAFTWQTGSIGWHLDSASATSPRGGSSWSPNALQRGIAVTSGAVAEPQTEGLARPGGVIRNLLEGANVGDAFMRNTRWLKWEIMNIGDPLYRPFGSGRPPFSPLQPVNSFSIVPWIVVGGAKSTGTITLSTPAPTGGITFTLNTSNASLTNIPANVSVPAGATKATFPISTSAVASPDGIIITATSASLTLRNTISIDPLLRDLVAATGTTTGGSQVSVTVLLEDRAPLGGASITLASDNSAASVPGSVMVPAGSMVASFLVSTTPVLSPTSANITASYAGTSRTATILINP